jgi:hypothetical protein
VGIAGTCALCDTSVLNEWPADACPQLPESQPSSKQSSSKQSSSLPQLELPRLLPRLLPLQLSSASSPLHCRPCAAAFHDRTFCTGSFSGAKPARRHGELHRLLLGDS